ncbi:MAG: hypothetical protein RLN89_05060 [Parvibaculum sp.]
MRDLHSNLKMVQSLDPAVTMTDRAGAPIDRQGYESVEHLVLVGASGETLSPALSLSLRLDESEDGSSWSPVTNDTDVVGGPVDPGGLFATIDDVAEDASTYAIGYVGNARFSRIALVLTGTHAVGTPVGAVTLLSHGTLKPLA